MNGLELAKNSGLHDFEVLAFTIDYAKATIVLNMISPMINNTSRQVSICITNFISISVSHQEPWGSGRYIYSSDIQYVRDDSYRLEIQLNSGDLLVVDYRGDEDKEDKRTVLLS